MTDPARQPESDDDRRHHDEPFAVDFVHRVRFTRDVFDPANLVLRDAIVAGGQGAGRAGRAIAVVDSEVAKAWPGLAEEIAAYADRHADVLELAAAPLVVSGGEPAKNDRGVYDAVVSLVDTARICRHSWVLAIGGGALLDAVGFAAATAHRGVRLVRFPTTTLAQCDAGLGVKNGINALGKKNFLGAFSVPWAVLNDERFLETLDDVHWRGGLSEAVKVALLKDPHLFTRIEDAAPALRHRDLPSMLPIVRRSAELHLEHITRGGDPFERRNARPLDFGHWSAHKLEQISDFRIGHGAAVALGVALDVTYSELDHRLDEVSAERILRTLERIGFPIFDEALRAPALLDGLEEFREHLGGRLTITLLSGIGYPVDVHAIDRERMMQAIGRLADRASEARRERGATRGRACGQGNAGDDAGGPWNSGART